MNWSGKGACYIVYFRWHENPGIYLSLKACARAIYEIEYETSLDDIDETIINDIVKNLEESKKVTINDNTYYIKTEFLWDIE